MLAFAGPCPIGLEVCHNDSNPTNNRLDNLRYDTRRSNRIDMVIAGNEGRQKLTVDDVRDIRARLDRGETGVSLAREYGVTTATISAVKNRRSFAWMD